MNDIPGTIEHGDKVKYTLLTENIPAKRDAVTEKVGQFFDGATYYDGLGVFQGTLENNLTIVVIATQGHENHFMAMAEEIRALLSQVEVWVIAEPVELTILSIPETARKDRAKWYQDRQLQPKV